MWPFGSGNSAGVGFRVRSNTVSSPSQKGQNTVAMATTKTYDSPSEAFQELQKLAEKIRAHSIFNMQICMAPGADDRPFGATCTAIVPEVVLSNANK